MREVELAVIGGGPAGMAACIEAAKSGVRAVLIDENRRPGGQIYRQLPETFMVHDPDRLGKSYFEGKAFLDEFNGWGDAVEFMDNAVVRSLYPDKAMEISRRDETTTLKAEKIILAEGAHERPMPFGGWTLPGVFTTGGVQRMIKNQRILPGNRFLLAGTGPMQLVVASQLLREGAEIAAVLETAGVKGMGKHLFKLWGQVRLVKDGLAYLNELRKAGVPFIRQAGIVAAHGDRRVEGARWAELDDDWAPVPGSETDIEVDTVCLGYGFVPLSRLSRLCGCRHQYRHELGGWLPEVDGHRETSVTGLFAAGDGSGVAGAMTAVLEGRVAGIRACRQLDRLDENEEDRRTRPYFKQLAGLRKFRAALDEVSSVRLGWFGRLADDVILCRCEEITAGDIRRLVREGVTDLREMRIFSRAGMGHCQGRMCESAIAALLAFETGRAVEDLGMFSVRPPVRPTHLRVMIGNMNLEA